MADIALLSPAWLLALPLLLLLWHRPRRSLPDLILRPVALRHPRAAELGGAQTSAAPSPWQRILPVVVLALLLTALAQPVRYGEPLPDRPAPMQLLLVLDTSVSMVLRDYELDGERMERLTLAKLLLDRFVADYRGSEIGLVVLGQPSALWVPLTTDHVLFRRLLARVAPVMAGRNAALGDALALGAQQFPPGDMQPRALVLITDAVNPSGRLSPQQGVERVKAAGLTLHTIAIGAAAGELESGLSELLYEPANLELLQGLAGHTGGLSFHARQAGDLQQALARIEAHHRPRQQVTDADRLQQPLYPWPLALAMLLLAAAPWLKGARHV